MEAGAINKLVLEKMDTAKDKVQTNLERYVQDRSPDLGLPPGVTIYFEKIANVLTIEVAFTEAYKVKKAYSEFELLAYNRPVTGIVEDLLRKLKRKLSEGV